MKAPSCLGIMFDTDTLVSGNQIQYQSNEAVPINEKFRLKKCLTEEKKKEAVLKELQRLKEKGQPL